MAIARVWHAQILKSQCPSICTICTHYIEDFENLRLALRWGDECLGYCMFSLLNELRHYMDCTGTFGDFWEFAPHQGGR